MSNTKLTNVEMVQQWRKENQSLLRSRIQCECGVSYTYPNKSQHFKTQKHKYRLEIESMRKQLLEESKNEPC